MEQLVHAMKVHMQTPAWHALLFASIMTYLAETHCCDSPQEPSQDRLTSIAVLTALAHKMKAELAESSEGVTSGEGDVLYLTLLAVSF